MEKSILERKVDSLLEELKSYIDSHTLSERELLVLKEEIDRLVYECLYYKNKIVS